MKVYRLTLPKYSDDLSGAGASLFGGRWNSMGNFVLYTAENSSLSVLEHLVHIQQTPTEPYSLSVLNIKNGKTLDLFEWIEEPSGHWLSDPSKTSKIGDLWIQEQLSPILKVPSIINPFESNYLINPNHHELQLEVENQEWFVYDQRLFKK